MSATILQHFTARKMKKSSKQTGESLQGRPQHSPSLGPRLSSRRVQSCHFHTRGYEALTPMKTNRLSVFQPPADGRKEEEERKR